MTAYAAAHPGIAATVAISLGDVPASRVRNLLVLYGEFELPLFANTARQTLAMTDPTVAPFP